MASAAEEKDAACSELVKYKSRSHMMLKKLERELVQEKRNNSKMAPVTPGGAAGEISVPNAGT